MEFSFTSMASAKAAVPIFRTQLFPITKKKVGVEASGNTVNAVLPSVAPQKKKVAEYTAQRLAELMRTLEKA